jgi:hypothetical protein
MTLPQHHAPLGIGDHAMVSTEPWKNRWTQFTILVLCALVSGVHLGALQLIAWAEMALRYSQSDGAIVALAKTFDGAHPCSRCRVVKSASENNGRESSTRPLARDIERADLKSILFANPRVIGPAWTLQFPSRPSCLALTSRRDEPESPEPKMA